MDIRMPKGAEKIINILKGLHIDLIHNQTDIGIGQFSRLAAKALRVPTGYTYHTAYEDYTYYVVEIAEVIDLAE